MIQWLNVYHVARDFVVQLIKPSPFLRLKGTTILISRQNSYDFKAPVIFSYECWQVLNESSSRSQLHDEMQFANENFASSHNIGSEIYDFRNFELTNGPNELHYTTMCSIRIIALIHNYVWWTIICHLTSFWFNRSSIIPEVVSSPLISFYVWSNFWFQLQTF